MPPIRYNQFQCCKKLSFELTNNLIASWLMTRYFPFLFPSWKIPSWAIYFVSTSSSGQSVTRSSWFVIICLDGEAVVTICTGGEVSKIEKYSTIDCVEPELGGHPKNAMQKWINYWKSGSSSYKKSAHLTLLSKDKFYSTLFLFI